MKKHFKKIPYKLKLLYTMWLFVIIPYLLVYGIATYVTIHNNSKTLTDTSEKIINSVYNDFNAIIDEIDDKFSFLSSFEKIQNVLTSISKETLYDTIDTSIEISSLFESIFYDYKQSDICIYTTNPNIFDMKYIKKIPNSMYNEFSVIPDNNNFTYTFKEIQGEYYFQYYKKFSFNTKDYHILSITLPINTLFTEINTDESIFCVYYNENSGSIIPLFSNKASHEEISEIFSHYLDSGKHTYYTVNILKDGYLRNNIYTFYCIKPFIFKIVFIVLSFIFILIFLILILYFIINTVVNNLTSRLSKITSEILESDSLLPAIKNDEEDDFDIIQNKLSAYAKKILENNDKILKLELELLNSKTSPHFLYNNLSTIKCFCDDEKIDIIIDNLVLYYRKVFHQSSAFVSVKQELENIKIYIELLKFAYDSDFKYTCLISPEAEEKNMPSNIIQPLIENAFIHGINNFEKDATFIRLDINTENDKLIITVINNGNPPDVERINKLLTDTDSTQSALSMIKKRLNLYFSKSADIHISYDDKLTTVKIEIPVIY